MNRRTRLEHRDFACKGPIHHHFRSAVRLQISDSGSAIERSAEFRPVLQSLSPWSVLPICPFCSSIAEELETYDPNASTIPSGQRMQVWLSPDGSAVAIPGARDRVMPDRYAVRGYRTVELHSMRDIDRIESIRARQTGNEITHEMQFSPERRKWHEEADYDPDSMTSII